MRSYSTQSVLQGSVWHSNEVLGHMRALLTACGPVTVSSYFKSSTNIVLVGMVLCMFWICGSKLYYLKKIKERKGEKKQTPQRNATAGFEPATVLL